MNVTITNLSPEIVTALEVLLKPFAKNKDIRIIKSYDDEVATAIKDFEAEDKAGKTKIYDTLADFKKAMSV